MQPLKYVTLPDVADFFLGAPEFGKVGRQQKKTCHERQGGVGAFSSPTKKCFLDVSLVGFNGGGDQLVGSRSPLHQKKNRGACFFVGLGS